MFLIHLSARIVKEELTRGSQSEGRLGSISGHAKRNLMTSDFLASNASRTKHRFPLKVSKQEGSGWQSFSLPFPALSRKQSWERWVWTQLLEANSCSTGRELPHLPQNPAGMPIAGRLPVHPFDKNESLETSSMTYYQSAVDPTHSVSLQDKIQNMDLPVCQCKVQTPDAGR
jgi:hypothetical protein